MAAPFRDPNRYAYGAEAASLRARITMESAQIELLQRHLDEAQAVEADAEAQFLEIEARYHSLLHMRDDAVAFSSEIRRRLVAQSQALSDHRRLLHPERRLPPEILGYIFEHCSDCVSDAYGYVPASERAILARQMQPFQLAAVCRRWRRVSLGHPRAWSQVELYLDAIDEDNAPFWIDFLDIFLERSACVPLTLRVLRERKPEIFNNDLVDHLSQVMLRCCTLQALLWHSRVGDPMLTVLSSQAPQLERAVLSVAYSHDADSEVVTWLLPLLNSPVLSTLWSAGFAIDGCAVELPSLSRAILTSPHCTDTRDDISQILKFSPALETLELSAPVISRETVPGSRVSGANLSTLVLTVFDTSPVERIVEFVSFPNLSSLTLCGNDTSAPQLYGLIQREADSWRLTQLRLVYVGSCQLLLPVLPRLKCLKLLRIEQTLFTSSALRSFCELLGQRDADDSWPCNQLTMIAFVRCRFDTDCDAGVLFRLMESRLGVPIPSGNAVSLQNSEGFALVFNCSAPSLDALLREVTP